MAARDDTPAILAPPPLLFLLALGAGSGLEVVLPTALVAALPAPLRFVVAGVALAAAGGLGLAGIAAFRRARTAVEPWHPTTALVTTGIYARVRNPMYLGLVLILAAVALAAASDGLVVATVGLALLLHVGVVRREERYLARHFGDDYRRYAERVPRWGVALPGERRTR